MAQPTTIGGLGITAKAARNRLTPLRSVFEDALHDELVEFNAFDAIALGKLGHHQRPKAMAAGWPVRANSRGIYVRIERP